MGGEEAIDDGNDDGIRSIEGSEWTLETTSIGTTGDGNAQGNESNSTNALLLELENSPADRRRLPLPLELNCQIFECLKFGIQRKFIGGLGRGIYGIFRLKVLAKRKRLLNPGQNDWEVSNTDSIIYSKGLLAHDNTGFWNNVCAKKGFPITGELSRIDNFPGTILYYFEVTEMSSSPHLRIHVGLSSGNLSAGSFVGFESNSYAIYRRFCWLSGNPHDFEWPNGVTEPEWNGPGDVFGCGLLMSPENKLSIFFTENGILIGKQIPIFPTVTSLYPTVTMHRTVSIVTNFGDNSAKPFSYDINKCPGMAFR